MLVSRSDLRKLRNKVYVRLFSSQNIQKHLLKYQNLTQEFIKRFESHLTWPEVCSLRRRVEVTMEAAAKASKNTTCDHLDEKFIHKTSQSMYMNSTFSRQQGMFDKFPLGDVGVSHCVSKDISSTAAFSEVIDQEAEKALHMDRMSEAMAIILDSASYNENYDMIKSFIGETQAVMTAASPDISSKTMFTGRDTSFSEAVDMAKAKEASISQTTLFPKSEEENFPELKPHPAPVNVTPWRRKGILFAKLF